MVVARVGAGLYGRRSLGRQGSYCEQKKCLTMDFGYIYGKRAHFRVVIVTVSDFQELNDRYWGANNYKGRAGEIIREVGGRGDLALEALEEKGP